MEFDKSTSAAQTSVSPKDMVKTAREQWKEAAKKGVLNNWTAPDDAPAWFEAPALAEVMKSEQPDQKAHAISNEVFDMFSRLQRAGRTFLEIRQLCSTQAASVLYPDLKKAYDEFISRKDKALAYEALNLLDDVVTQATKQELVSLSNKDSVDNYITNIENQATQIIADTQAVEKELTQKNIHYTDYTERMKKHAQCIASLKQKQTWDAQDCLKICSLQQDSEQLKKQLEFKKSQLNTYHQRQEAVEKLDRELAPLHFQRRVITAVATCVAVGICIVQIISMRKKYKDDEEVRAH
jgi:hypothetical protein